jgi:hypothetical protein
MERSEALPHVKWEMERLAREFDLFVECVDDDSERACERALELTLLHARNLAEFFTTSRTKNRLVCGHFGYSMRVRTPLLARGVLDLINWQLSHLTTKRLHPSPPWPLGEICGPIFDACANFAKHIEEAGPTADRAEWGRISRRMAEAAQSASSAGTKGIGATG